MIIVSLVFVLGVVIGLAYLTVRRILEDMFPPRRDPLEGTVELEKLVAGSDFRCENPTCPCNRRIDP